MAQSLNLKAVKHKPSQFTSVFCELYCSIMQNVYTLNSQNFLNDVKGELRNIRRVKKSIANSEKTSSLGDIKYEAIAVRCAYMYSYSVLNTIVVYSEFSKHLEQNKNEKMLLQHFSSKTLKLCCLGGGAGIEAVGVSRAIHDIIWKSHCEDAISLVDVHVTVVDICSEWKSEQCAIENALNKNSHLFHSITVNFHVDYFKADLVKPFEKTLKNIIQKANIITIVNFVNAVQDASRKDCIPKLQVMMERTIGCMAEESCLFMLDPAGGSVFYRVADVTSRHRSVFETKMNSHKAYRLNAQILKRLGGVLNFRGFSETDTLFPTEMARVSSCIWIKKTFSTKGERGDKTEAEDKKMVEKGKESNDKKMKKLEEKKNEIHKKERKEIHKKERKEIEEKEKLKSGMRKT